MLIHTADKRNTINWASGTSTEIFIYPHTGSFAERDFIFRISTATVESEESEFTFFKGITRHLMILEGELQLIHEGRYTKTLKPFDQDIFSGEWKTRSRGKVTDFNLMLKGGATGSLKHHHLKPGEISFTGESEFNFIYLASGSGDCNNVPVHSGDLVAYDKKEIVVFQMQDNCDFIEITVAENGA